MGSSEDSPDTWRLRALHHADDSEDLEVTGEGLTIGRSDSNSVVLTSEEFPGVSSTHARVVLRDDCVYVEDVESKNGTLIGGTRIRREALDHGDVFELGLGGPRFVVLGPTQTDQTVVFESRPKKVIGAETVEVMREKLGIPANTKVTEVVRRRTRHNTRLLGALVLVLVVGAFYLYSESQRREQEMAELIARIDSQLATSKDELEAFRVESEQHMHQLETDFDASSAKQREELKSQQTELEAQLSTRVSDEELARLRSSLDETEKRLAQLDPLTQAQLRLANVGTIEHAVVLIDVEQTFYEPSTDRQLYIGEFGDPNLSGEGAPYVSESTGSGFCFSEEGWILTNAHVVLKKDSQGELALRSGLVLQSRETVHVVFTGETEGRPAVVHDWVATGRKDLALIKIDKFDGIPHIQGIDTEQARPPSGTEVFLLGFPYGRRAMQDGNKMIASTFRGIVSRSVAEYLQVDAPVHPGNSGGPVIEDDGTVIGVVVGMQRIDDVQAAPDIGYIIPISHAKELWPPKAITNGK